MIEADMPIPKVFVGLRVPSSLARLLSDFRPTRGIEAEGVRWSEPRDLHITLKFLGAVAATTITQIVWKLRTIRSTRFTVCLVKADVFEDAGVLVVDIEKSAALLSIQTAVDQLVSNDGASLKARVFWPHITLARWNPIADDQVSNFDDIRTQLDSYTSALPVRSFLVEEIILYETVSGHYRISDKFRLGG